MNGWFSSGTSPFGRKNKSDRGIVRQNGSQRPSGFSEEALRGLDDLDARIPPMDVETRPAFSPAFKHRDRLAKEVTAGGGLLIDSEGNKVPHYWGHRERLRSRFLKGGHAPMPEYEILELLLFNAIPRIDVKPLAKRLLSAFGDLNGVVAASEHRILKVEGATEKVYYQLKLAEAFALRMGQAKVLKRSVMSSWDDLMVYCRTAMAHRETEQFRILFLDRKNVMIADEEQAKGTVDHVPVYPREVAKRALELNASAVILVHNHPSGDPSPSRQDVAMTDDVASACHAIGVTIHDHVIIGKDEEFSFKADGLLA